MPQENQYPGPAHKGHSRRESPVQKGDAPPAPGPVLISGICSTFLDTVRDGILVLHGGKVADCNAFASRLFGRERRDLLGRDLLQLSARNQPRENDSSGLLEQRLQAALSGKSQVFEWLFEDLGGREFYCEVTLSPLAIEEDHHLLAMVRDISSRKQAQEKLAQKAAQLEHRNLELDELKSILLTSRNKLKGVFDALDEPVFSLAKDLVIESVNLSAAALTGLHPRKLAGLSIEQYLAKAKAGKELGIGIIRGFGAMLAQGNVQYTPVKIPGPEHDSYYDITTTPVIDGAGRIQMGIVHIKDVTTYKRMERTIKGYNRRLEQKVAERTQELSTANQELKRLDQLRRDLTSMVVHDMKSPLAELMGNLDLLLHQGVAEEQQDTLEMALLGSRDLLRMIMNLLDISRMETGRLRIQPAPVDFLQLAETVTARFTTMIRLKGLKVEARDHGASPFSGDKDLLDRLLQNLLANALHHTNEGGVLLEARPGSGNGQEAGQGEGLVISVRDTGEGIPKEFHQSIFNKFTQAGDSGPRTSTGLGLSFCSLAAKVHGGRIWLDSAAGQGATFSVWLPGAC